jgi:hypothetical protein
MIDGDLPLDAAEDYIFGACDDCGRPSNVMFHVPGADGLGWDHWVVDHECMTRWYWGKNLQQGFCEWLEEHDPVCLAQMEQELPRYRVVSGEPPDWAVAAIRSRRYSE